MKPMNLNKAAPDCVWGRKSVAHWSRRMFLAHLLRVGIGYAETFLSHIHAGLVGGVSHEPFVGLGTVMNVAPSPTKYSSRQVIGVIPKLGSSTTCDLRALVSKKLTLHRLAWQGGNDNTLF